MIFENKIGKVVTVFNTYIAVELLRDKRYTGCYIGVKVDKYNPKQVVWIFYCSKKFVVGFNEIVKRRRMEKWNTEVDDYSL